MKDISRRIIPVNQTSPERKKKKNKVRTRAKQRIEVVVMTRVFLDNRTIERRVLEHTTRGQGRRDGQRRAKDAKKL